MWWCAVAVWRAIQLLKKCPISEFKDIFATCGLGAELNALPAALTKQKFLTRPLILLQKGGVEASRQALQQLAQSYDPLTKKRKVVEEDVDTTGVATKDIQKMIKKLGCTMSQAVKWLRAKDLDVENALNYYDRQIDMMGFVEDVE